MERKIWYRVADGTQALQGVTSIKHTKMVNIDDFRVVLAQEHPDEVNSAKRDHLTVCKNMEAFAKRVPLKMSAKLNNYEKKNQEEALIVHVPKVWFQLVAADTGALADAANVPLTEQSSVEQLRDVVKGKYRDSYLSGIDASELTVYPSANAARGQTSLPPSVQLRDRGATERNLLLVVVPQRASPETLLTKRPASIDFVVEEWKKKMKMLTLLETENEQAQDVASRYRAAAEMLKNSQETKARSFSTIRMNLPQL